MQDLTVKLGPGGALLVHVPGVGAGHTLTLPATIDGLNVLMQVLQNREREKSRSIGLSGAPLQCMVDQWLKDNKPTRAEDEELADSLDLTGIFV